MTDVNDFLMGGGGKSAEFKAHGDQVWGEIVTSEVRQQIDFATKKPKFYDDGNAMMQLVVTLQTTERDDDEDDGVRKVYARGRMLNSIRDAVRKAGATGIANRGKLLVRYTGDVPTNLSPAKEYFTKYEPPTTTVPSAQEPDDTPF